jgi:ABC-type sugar transport system permease subunit
MKVQTRMLERANHPAQRRQFKVDLLPYILLLPSVALILAIIFYPFVTGLLYSLREGSLLRLGPYVGLQNFVELFGSPRFRYSAYFTFIFVVFNIVGCYTLGLALAMLVNQNVPGRGFFRVALLIPWILPSVVAITGWRWLIADQYGLVNVFLKQLGIGPIYFLSNENWAVVSVIVVKIWRSFPFMMLSLLAALQGISRELYEAAKLDGAGGFQLFRYVTLPQLKNISIVLCILMTIWTVNGFDSIWLLTQGGPSNATENFIVLAFNYTFTRNDVGTGAAIAVVSFVVMAILTVLLLRAQEEAA